MKPDADVYWSAHDTFIDPVASNVYELLFESEDESADARQVHAGLSASLFLPAPLMRIIRPSCFIRAPDISTILLDPTARRCRGWSRPHF